MELSDTHLKVIMQSNDVSIPTRYSFEDGYFVADHMLTSLHELFVDHLKVNDLHVSPTLTGNRNRRVVGLSRSPCRHNISLS